MILVCQVNNAQKKRPAVLCVYRGACGFKENVMMSYTAHLLISSTPSATTEGNTPTFFIASI